MTEDFGTLFNTIPLTTEKHLDVLLDTMDKSRAIFILQQAVNHAFKQGAFTLGESEVLGKAIRISSESTTDEEKLNEID
ncbi:hypothetical protein OAB94_02645 [Flavobacteriaceae bacterium]|nr:hypothetical protein [bacterium]MDB0072676.1 hypothetical protein [bacterium]MDB4234954.1 hypothetical protein [bacterium]MDB4351841.1 hypothetical protein [Porticoccaceae bacterium]MDB9801256.1 hypothetical protein [Flavobacteriaceae bacterium]